jgi:hypothetical protein
MQLSNDFIPLASYNSSILLNLLESIDISIWDKSEHRLSDGLNTDVKSIVYVWSDILDEDYKNIMTIITEEHDEISKEVWKIANLIKNKFGSKSKITKLFLAKLKPNGHISSHTDDGNLAKIHRCHLVIKSNDSCIFTIKNNNYVFPVGLVFEVNNEVLHSVYNKGDSDRIHLIIDILN